MTKLEPVVADEGELIIYAPHITEFSYTQVKSWLKLASACNLAYNGI
ncbi:hypothetical protein [Scytonema sp. NUACC26]